MAPTRELAIQIFNDAEPLLASIGLKAALAYGGESYDKQLAKLQSGVDILIGTISRIIDFYKQRVFNLNHIQAVVLDEADRMFDLGFIKDIRFLFRRMPEPKDRLNMLFSATLSYRVQELAFEHMNNPEHVVVEPEQNLSSHSGRAVLPIKRTQDGAATDSYRRRVARSRNHFC